MNNRIMKVILGVVMSAAILIGSQIPTNAAVAITKTTADVSDTAVASYSQILSARVPAEVVNAFCKRGGAVSVSNTLDLAALGLIPHGWNNVNAASVSGLAMHDALGTSVPLIYLKADLVNNRKGYKPLSAERNICHEFGHFICGQASEIKTGVYNPLTTVDFANLYALEKSGYTNTPKMLGTLTGSFASLNSAEEFYANIAAGLMIDPVNTQAAFPQASAYVMNDINLIKTTYALQP